MSRGQALTEPPRRNIFAAFSLTILFAGACGTAFGWWADRIYEKGRDSGTSQDALAIGLGVGLTVALFVVVSLALQAFSWARGGRRESKSSKLAKVIAFTFGGGSLASAAAFANGSRPYQLATITFIGTSVVLVSLSLPFIALASPRSERLPSEGDQ